MISLNNAGIGYGARELFSKVSLQLNSGTRYAVAGANGAGKSTLLKLIAQKEHLTDGEISIQKGARIAYLDQELTFDESISALDVAVSGNYELWHYLEKKKKLLADPDANHSEIGDLEDEILTHGGATAASDAGRILAGLGLPHQLHELEFRLLSGGQKMRALLARALYANPDILLLDEPTNHLDIVGIRWLENFLKHQFKGMLLLISHDRLFIAHIVDAVLDVDYKTITLFNMSFTRFQSARTLAAEQKLREVESAKKKIAEMQEFVDRFKAKASKARQAQSRVKQIEKIEIPEIVESSRRFPKFRFDFNRTPGRDILIANNLSKAFSEKKLFSNIEFGLHKGDKAAIIGPNGHGKSTLLRIIAGDMTPDQGTHRFGHETHVGYYAQEHGQLRKYDTPLHEWLSERHRQEPIKNVRQTLGMMLFSGDDAKKKISHLSGGELARLVFADILIRKPNFLILDEPTNHLDIEAIEALETALAEYQGTVLMVSHDREFIRKISNRIFKLDSGQFQEILPSAFKDEFNADQSDASQGKNSNGNANAEPNDYEQRKKQKSETLKQQTRLKNLENEIAQHENKIAQIDSTLSDSERLLSMSPVQIRELSESRLKLQADLDGKLAAWVLNAPEVGKKS